MQFVRCPGYPLDVREFPWMQPGSHPFIREFVITLWCIYEFAERMCLVAFVVPADRAKDVLRGVPCVGVD